MKRKLVNLFPDEEDEDGSSSSVLLPSSPDEIGASAGSPILTRRAATRFKKTTEDMENVNETLSDCKLTKSKEETSNETDKEVTSINLTPSESDLIEANQNASISDMSTADWYTRHCTKAITNEDLKESRNVVRTVLSSLENDITIDQCAKKAKPLEKFNQTNSSCEMFSSYVGQTDSIAFSIPVNGFPTDPCKRSNDIIPRRHSQVIDSDEEYEYVHNNQDKVRLIFVEISIQLHQPISFFVFSINVNTNANKFSKE